MKPHYLTIRNQEGETTYDFKLLIEQSSDEPPSSKIIYIKCILNLFTNTSWKLFLQNQNFPFNFTDQPLSEISKDGNFGECYFQDTTYGSDDMAFSIGLKNTPEECQTHCQNTTGCNYFVYESKPKRCRLKSFEDDLYYSKGTIAGPRYCGECITK